MLLKIAILVVVFSLICRWAIGKWPWDFAKPSSATDRRLASARRTLGVGPQADKAEILAAHKLVLTRVHPDRGGSVQQVFEANDARDVLLEALGEPPVVVEGNARDETSGKASDSDTKPSQD